MKKTEKGEVPARKRVRRSDATRERIQEAARELFARLGYERTTVRLIAEKADIHPSLVIRYFESKERLFAESSSFNLQFPDLSSVPVKKRGAAMVRHFLDRWEANDPAGELPALLRLAVTHPDGREKMTAVFKKQVEPAVRRMTSSGDAGKSAALIATQIVGLAFLRYVVGLPGVVKLGHEDLVEQVGRTIQSYLELKA